MEFPPRRISSFAPPRPESRQRAVTQVEGLRKTEWHPPGNSASVKTVAAKDVTCLVARCFGALLLDVAPRSVPFGSGRGTALLDRSCGLGIVNSWIADIYPSATYPGQSGPTRFEPTERKLDTRNVPMQRGFRKSGDVSGRHPQAGSNPVSPTRSKAFFRQSDALEGPHPTRTPTKAAAALNRWQLTRGPQMQQT
jgi:hypothetical protein